MLKNIPQDWQKILSSGEGGDDFIAALEKVSTFLNKEKQNGATIFPAEENIFNALKMTPFNEVKVVILGQDPYHDFGQAYGLAFSVPENMKKLPPSLKNIYKELAADVGCDIASHGCLDSWAEQGVLLINTVLTVRAHEANSHKNIGWELVTDLIIRNISNRKENVVFILWGANAISKKNLIDCTKHAVIESVHPSPLSASRGFFGSKPFSKCNAALEKFGLKSIDWQIKNRNELF